MAKQLLRDAAVKPTDEIIADGMGVANSTYKKYYSIAMSGKSGFQYD